MTTKTTTVQHTPGPSWTAELLRAPWRHRMYEHTQSPPCECERCQADRVERRAALRTARGEE